MSVAELIAFSDEALAGLEHRRIDFEDAELGDALRAGFEAEGLADRAARLDAPRGPAASRPRGAGGGGALRRRARAARDLAPRGFPGPRPERVPGTGALRRAARRYPDARRRDDAGSPVAYTQLERLGRAAEIAHVFVHPEHRGAGLGTAVTRAAIEAASGVDEPADRGRRRGPSQGALQAARLQAGVEGGRDAATALSFTGASRDRHESVTKPLQRAHTLRPCDGRIPVTCCPARPPSSAALLVALLGLNADADEPRPHPRRRAPSSCSCSA